MDLEVIKTVLTVARLKSFTAASYAIPCSQSSVSRRIEAAEDELGTAIFVRPSLGGSKNVELTKKGELIIQAMKNVVEAYSELYYAASGGDQMQITLEIGMRRNMIAPMGVSLMKADFFEKYPDTAISIIQDNFDILFSKMKRNELDALLFSCTKLDPLYFQPPKGCKLLYLGDMNIRIGLSDKNPLSKQPEIYPGDLDNETFFLGDKATDVMPGIEFYDPSRFETLFSEGKHPKIKVLPSEQTDIRYKLTMENKGMIPSYTPDSWRHLEGIVYLPIKESKLKSSYYFLYIPTYKENELLSFARFFASHLDHNAM